ncbi:MAG: hypothetical protein ACRD21_02945 [Vicinamibacteria bacterium]
MARLCPSCGRPNSDSASRCLYCVAELPPAEIPSHAATVPAVDVAPVSLERHLLILLARPLPEEAGIQEFSRITGLSAYDARLSSSSRRARLFRRIESEAEARRLSEEFSRARVAHYVVAESSVVSLPVATASGIDFRDRHLEVHLGGATRSVLPMPYEELLLLVRGEITRERHDDRKLGSPRGSSRRLTSGLRLHLYAREASMAVEIDPDRFDFRALAERQTSSVLLNLERLASRVSEKKPDLTLDRGFDQEPLILSRSGADGEVTDALSDKNRGREGVVYDDEANFRFYARWRYRVARHVARRQPGE